MDSIPNQTRPQEVYSIVPFVAADGTVYLVFRKDLDNFKKKFNIDDFHEKNGVLFSEKHQLSKEDDDVFIVNVSDGPPPPPPPPQANVVLVQLGQIPNYDNIDLFVENTLHLAVRLLFTIDALRKPLQQEQTPPPPQHQPPSDQDIDAMIQEISANIKKFLKEFLKEKKGGKKRSSSTIRKSSSSRRGRRSAKKRGTKRKQKRRQRRASRRAY